MSAKLSNTHSIFYEKLKEAQTKPNLLCYLIIIPQNKWLKVENIIDLTPKYLTFSFYWKDNSQSLYVEETVLLNSIRNLRICIPTCTDTKENKEYLKKLYNK